MLEDPVPGEIAKRNRGKAGGCGRGDSERGQIGHCEDCAVRVKKPQLAGDASVERRHERLGARDGSWHVKMQAVQLDHAGIDFDR